MSCLLAGYVTARAIASDLGVHLLDVGCTVRRHYCEDHGYGLRVLHLTGRSRLCSILRIHFGAAPPPPPLDVQARMKARKEEEARRREAELLNARKAYFEERKQAAARQQQLYQPSPNNHAVTTHRCASSTSGAPQLA